jgi:hypothetical protein
MDANTWSAAYAIICGVTLVILCRVTKSLGPLTFRPVSYHPPILSPSAAALLRKTRSATCCGGHQVRVIVELINILEQGHGPGRGLS